MSDGDPGDEPVEVVAEDGTVIRTVTRRQMRAERLRHRSTYIAVVTSADELVVHRRADWKDVYPGWWDIAFGGVCGVGEAWTTAARRELAEEAGVEHAVLTELGSGTYDGDDGRVVGRIFLAHHDGPLSCPDGEVVEVDRIPLAGLDDWMADRPVAIDSRELVAPLLRSVLKNR